MFVVAGHALKKFLSGVVCLVVLSGGFVLFRREVVGMLVKKTGGVC